MNQKGGPVSGTPFPNCLADYADQNLKFVFTNQVRPV